LAPNSEPVAVSLVQSTQKDDHGARSGSQRNEQAAARRAAGGETPLFAANDDDAGARSRSQNGSGGPSLQRGSRYMRIDPNSEFLRGV
jgi:hypothetical protein